MGDFVNYNKSRQSDKRTARLGNLVCSLLFVLFSVVYLGIFQRDVMEALHFSLAHGKTTFAIVPTTIVITILLLALRWVVNILMKLKGWTSVFAFVPSFIGLVALTDVDRSLYKCDYAGMWWWLMPLLTVVIVVAVRIMKGGDDYSVGKGSEPKWAIIWNVFVMLMLSLATLTIGNTNKVFHNELRMEHLLVNGNNEEVLKVARLSDRTSRTMTALRGLAMSKENVMGEKLFEYPQYFEADGLFFSNDSCETLRYTNDSIYDMLGDTPKDWEDSQSFLKRICYEETGTSKAVEYYLMALLLNKDLNEYAVAIGDFMMKGDTIQRYLKEAVVMYREMNPEWELVVDADSMTYDRFMEYKVFKNRPFATEKERENRLRKRFGDTYWWYYDYQK